MNEIIHNAINNEKFANLHIDEANLQQVLNLLVDQRKKADPNFDAANLDLVALLDDAIKRRRFMPTPDGTYTIKEAFVFFSIYEDRNGLSQLSVHRAYRITDGKSDYQLECTNWGQERTRYTIKGNPVVLPFVVSNNNLIKMSGNGAASEWIQQTVPQLVGATIKVTNHNQPIDKYTPKEGRDFQSVQVRQVDIIRLHDEQADEPASTWTKLE